MNAPTSVDNRFLPQSAQDYSRRAKHLAWITQRPLQLCQEILAKAYGYSGAHEVRALIAAGRVEGDPESDWLATAGRRMQMEGEFGNRLLDVLAGGNTRADLATLKPRDWLARDIGLAQPWEEHKREFTRVQNSILVASMEEPEALRGTTPLDYGRAYRTSSGDYTIALTAAGQAVRDVLTRWYEEEEGSQPISARAQRDRIAALRARHSGNPWLVANAVLSTGYALSCAGDHSSDAWQDVLTEARTAIALFERILSSEQCARYAGAKLISAGLGFGNEAYSYPSTLFYAGVAALNTNRVSEAIGFLERAYLTDPRDGAGARFSLNYAYAVRAGHAEPPAFWDELTFGQILRAITLIETGDHEAGVDAFAYALVERLWQEFNNGYKRAPRSFTGLLKAAAPVATSHAEAWSTLTAVAKDATVQRVIRDFMAMARRSFYVDLDHDSAFLAEQIRDALDEESTSE
ncbi:MAG: hypothetical protein WC617_12310 [Rhodanobacter sp.]|jgi:hypothetical protein